MIKSFEEGAAQAGDILTGGKKRQPLKIGILTCGYFEYWRMYPTLKEKVEGDLRAVTDRISSMYPSVVLSDMVDTLDSADAAGRKLKAADIDVVLLVYGTYTADFITLTALDYVREKPLFIFSTQPHANVDRKGNYEGSLRNSAIIGIAQLTGTLRKMRRDYKIVVGSVEDERAYRKIGVLMRAAQAVKDLHEANIGIIGHVFRGMYDLEISKTFFKNAFGANIIQIQSSHLLEAWSEVKEEDVDVSPLTSRFALKNVTKDDVRRALRLAVAMQNITERFSLDAMCFLDQHFVQKQVRTTARMGASLIMEHSDRSVNCEGDLCGLVTMMLMRSISGRAAFMGEWGEYDEETNSVLVIGHGIGTSDMAASEADVSLCRTPEEWGFEGAGLNYELIVKPGKATLAHIMEGPDGYRMIISRGESIDFPKLDFDELHLLFRVKRPVKEYLEAVFSFGVSHHCIVGIGDMAEELSAVADLLGIQKFIIE